jgi:hypothetical protein
MMMFGWSVLFLIGSLGWFGKLCSHASICTACWVPKYALPGVGFMDGLVGRCSSIDCLPCILFLRGKKRKQRLLCIATAPVCIDLGTLPGRLPQSCSSCCVSQGKGGPSGSSSGPLHVSHLQAFVVAHLVDWVLLCVMPATCVIQPTSAAVA